MQRTIAVWLVCLGIVLTAACESAERRNFREGLEAREASLIERRDLATSFAADLTAELEEHGASGGRRVSGARGAAGDRQRRLLGLGRGSPGTGATGTRCAGPGPPRGVRAQPPGRALPLPAGHARGREGVDRRRHRGGDRDPAGAPGRLVPNGAGDGDHAHRRAAAGVDGLGARGDRGLACPPARRLDGRRPERTVGRRRHALRVERLPLSPVFPGTCATQYAAPC